MLKLRLVWRTDVHLSDRPPQSRRDDWESSLIGKLEQIRHIAHNMKAMAVLDGGDFFHVKSPVRTPHRLIQRVAELHKTYSCPVYATVGNHDCVYGDIDFLPQQPLGVLFATGVFQRLYNEHEVYFGPGVWDGTGEGVYPYNRATDAWAAGDPFQYATDRDDRVPIVRVVGVPYHGTSYDMARLSGIGKGREDYLVVIAHMLASKRGGTMFEREDIVSYDDLAGMAGDLFCFGHWHKNQGVKEIAPGKFVVNVGSLSRGSLAEDDVGRIPTCALLSFGDRIEIEERELVVQPPRDVFDLAGRQKRIERDQSAEHFVKSLKESLGWDKPKESLLEQVRTIPDLPDEVRERVLLYLEENTQ